MSLDAVNGQMHTAFMVSMLACTFQTTTFQTVLLSRQVTATPIWRWVEGAAALEGRTATQQVQVYIGACCLVSSLVWNGLCVLIKCLNGLEHCEASRRTHTCASLLHPADSTTPH